MAATDAQAAQQPQPDLGVYIHVPFCDRICPYCDFAVVRAEGMPEAVERRYVDALLLELAARAPESRAARLDTLYFGGGTPSLFAPDSIATLVAGVRSHFAAGPGARSGGGGPVEVTLEVNPSTTERERLPGFLQAGVDRLSIGVQSFDDGVLKRLGRAHASGEAHATLRAARDAGFENLSIDLIVAAPGQSSAGLDRDLDEALAYEPEHLSAYELTIESGTPFALAHARGQLALPSEDEGAAFFERLCARAADAGLERYEVSSFARRGYESRHNTRYWRRQPVLGLGVGAWSYEPAGSRSPAGIRRGNTRVLGDYLRRVEARTLPEESRDVLSLEESRGEAIWLALRHREGLRAADFSAEFGAPPRSFYARAIEDACSEGLLEESEQGDLRLSARGWRFADQLALGFLDTSSR